MGRPAKNPENPLTRLRKTLSTPAREMTRAMFSKKVGIPEATIKAIETGKFKLSDKNAAQIASVTKVDPKCLMDPGLPLTDYMGVSLDGRGKPFAAYFGDKFLDVRALVEAAFEVAEEKRKQAVFLFLFQRWIEETSEILGLGPAIIHKLQERYPLQCFGAIPKYFWPRDREKRKDMDKRVKSFEKRLIAEVGKALAAGETEVVFNAEEATLDPEAFLERWINAGSENLDPWSKHVVERICREESGFAQLAWDLRKKMIEVAKASLQKQPN